MVPCELALFVIRSLWSTLLPFQFRRKPKLVKIWTYALLKIHDSIMGYSVLRKSDESPWLARSWQDLCNIRYPGLESGVHGGSVSPTLTVACTRSVGRNTPIGSLNSPTEVFILACTFSCESRRGTRLHLNRNNFPPGRNSCNRIQFGKL